MAGGAVLLPSADRSPMFLEEPFGQPIAKPIRPGNSPGLPGVRKYLIKDVILAVSQGRKRFRKRFEQDKELKVLHTRVEDELLKIKI